MQRQKSAHSFSMGDGAPVANDVSNRRADMNPLCLREDQMRDLQDVRVQADFTFEFWDHSTRIFFLDLTRQMRFGNPGGFKTQIIGVPNLIKKVQEHLPLGRHVPIDFGLANGKEEIEFHKLGVRPPSTGRLTPEM